jgi:hypothetical protein
VSPAVHHSTASDITIYPDGAKVNTLITLKTDRSLIYGGDVQWYINNIINESSKGVTFHAETLSKGDVVKAVIVADGKEYTSNEIIIKNTPPDFVTAKLLPSRPKLDSTFSLEVRAKDVDDDHVSFKYRWTVNDTFAGEDNYLNMDFKRGDNVTVEITPHDGEVSGKSIRLTESILNSLPVFTESEPSFDGKTYTYKMHITDPDNDTLAYTLEQGPEGMKVDPASGSITWEVAEKDKGSHEVKVRVKDNNGGELLIPFTTRIRFD